MKGGAGAKRHFITFQKKPYPEPQSRSGQPIGEYADVFETMAELQYLGSREFPERNKRYAETTARFRIWYHGTIDPALHQILQVIDPDASPPVTQTWNIHGVSIVDNQFLEQDIEVSEIK